MGKCILSKFSINLQMAKLRLNCVPKNKTIFCIFDLSYSASDSSNANDVGENVLVIVL